MRRHAVLRCAVLGLCWHCAALGRCCAALRAVRARAKLGNQGTAGVAQMRLPLPSPSTGGKATPEIEELCKERGWGPGHTMRQALLNHQKVKKWTKVGGWAGLGSAGGLVREEGTATLFLVGKQRNVCRHGGVGSQPNLFCNRQLNWL